MFAAALCMLSLISQGQRPYEMVWAGRTEDEHPPLVAFDDVAGWTVECDNAAATLASSTEQLLFRDAVAKLAYRREAPGSTAVRLIPPGPIAVAAPFDSVNWWVYGNNWAFAPDASTPAVTLTAVFGSPGGPDVLVTLGSVGWQEWWVMHRRLTPEQIAAVGASPELRRIEVTGGTNRDARALYLANLSVYTEELAPLTFEPRPKRSLTPLPGQDLGANTGSGTLPFPTREETMLPGAETVTVARPEERDGAYTWTTDTGGAPTTWTYRPESGTLSDVTVQVAGQEPLHPLEGGGVMLVGPDGQATVPEQATLLEIGRDGDTVRSRWSVVAGDRQGEVEYAFRVWNASLVVDVLCPGGTVSEVRFGRASGAGVVSPRLVTLPYLTYGGSRPAVLVIGTEESPWFLSGYPDWYRSNASRLEARNDIDEAGAACYNGAAVYLPKTDGQRNDCVERLFVTLASRFEDVLPNIANPRSPWIDVTSERVWIAHGASDRQSDYAYWAERARLGMAKILITDHETGWRDGGESFTLRTRTAPGRGGDESQAWYAKAIQDLGFRYGIYNNYTDFAPVNEHWDEDYVSRVSDGQWRPAWPRCYNLKPSRAVELESRLAPIIQSKFHLSTAYCDVHTAVQPWDYTDFDARVPGAATFAATYYAYGEIMLHQKATWDGPVYSEGNAHWTYVGLTDGNYGQDQGGRLPTSPWLVDFDLRKMHPHGIGFGMGMPSMFYPYGESLGATPDERTARIDRFLAATVAFGHTGYLVGDLGIPGQARSYFMIQQLAKGYAPDTVARIEYADERGRMLDPSHAVASGAYTRSQIRTEYQGGTVTTVNGHPSEAWQCAAPAAVLDSLGVPESVRSVDGLTLSPNGYLGYVLNGDHVSLAVLSTEVDGHRVDYADTPEYLFLDGRGQYVRFAKAATDGSFAAIPQGDGTLEVIPYGETSHIAVALDGRGADAVALDMDRREIGPADTRYCRGLVHVAPVEGAVSYRLTPKPAPAVVLRCDRTEVVPGEVITITGAVAHTYVVPRDAAPGEMLYAEFEGGCVDLLVRPMVEARLELPSATERAVGEAKLRLTLESRLPSEEEVAVRLADRSQRIALPAGEEVVLEFPLDEPTEESVRELPLMVTSPTSEHRRTWWLKTELGTVEVAPMPECFTPGQRMRGGREQPLSGNTGARADRTTSACGEVSKPTLFMHPPWMGGNGYAFALLEPVRLPEAPAAVFRCVVGKQDGSDPGDGILFRALVVTDDGAETEVGRTTVTEHAWLPFEADLSPWAGQSLRLKLVADCGEADNTSGDWACWAEMRIEEAEPSLVLTLHDRPVELAHAPGPAPLAGVTLADLRGARRGWVSYEAAGLDSYPPYVSDMVVNGLNVGSMPSGTGNEVDGAWGDPVRVDLTPEAIAALTPTTVLKVRNAGSDFFKIRRFCVIVELADGRTFSSDVHTLAYAQPPTWAYAEGTGIPFGEEITADVRFALAE